MQLTVFNWFLAFLPVLVVLILMVVARWSGSRAGAASWFAAIAVAVLAFGAGPKLIAYTQVKAILLSLDILYIVWTALLLFHSANEAGAVRIIGRKLPSLTSSRTFQGLLLAWLFASFLQGMSGFGVPVAVTAPLLVGLGFTPLQAVVMACMGHGWAVNFGSMATSFQTLLAVTGLPGSFLAPESAILCGLASLASGSVVAYVAGGWKGLRHNFSAIVVLGLLMAAVQYGLVTQGLWTVGSTGAGMAGLLAGVGMARLPWFNGRDHEHPETDHGEELLSSKNRPRSVWVALSAYAVLVSLSFAVGLIEPLDRALSTLRVTLYIPELSTSYGWVNPAGPAHWISILNHPGTLILVSSIIAFLIYKQAGYYQPGALKNILRQTAAGSVNASLGIAAMVGMAVVMSSSGMTSLLAEGLSRSFGASFYPLVAPLIGAMGAFITGSNNNSNVLFALLQQRTAELLGLSTSLILSAQTAGGSLGSVMAPAKVIVASSTVGLGDKEGEVMGPILFYGILPVLLISLLTFLFATVQP